jgi:RimJ/RimL family protein N-acetyltransferase
MMKIREIQLKDARALLKLNKRLDEETKFMMLEPGERDPSIEGQVSRIQGFIERRNHQLFVAQAEDELVGYIAIMGGPYQRNSHKADIVIGILQDYTGMGLGSELFRHAEVWARQVGLHRLQLTVMTHNERAIALYKKMGFSVEGEIKHSLFVDGEYVDEISMFKIVTQEAAEQGAVPDATSPRQ